VARIKIIGGREFFILVPKMKAEIEDITIFCALFAACMVLLGRPVALMCLAGWRRLFWLM
jgi:hypothetical protein